MLSVGAHLYGALLRCETIQVYGLSQDFVSMSDIFSVLRSHLRLMYGDEIHNVIGENSNIFSIV